MSAAESARARQAALASKAEQSSTLEVAPQAVATKPRWTPVADLVAWWRRKKLENEKRMLRNEEVMKQDLERFLMEIEEQHTWVESELNYRNLERLRREEVIERAKRKERERLAVQDRAQNMEQGLSYSLGNVESFRRWQNSSAKYQDITGHEGAVYSVKLSPCLQYAFSCSADCTARLWSLEEGRTKYPLLVFEGHAKKVIDCAVHPAFKMDEQVAHLMTCSGDGTIRLWGTRSERAMRAVDAHTEAVYRVTFSRDGRRVASASEDMTVKSWCFPEMYCLYVYSGHASAVTALDFSPTCRYLASGSDYGERRILLWDSQMPRFETPLQYPHMLFWSPEGLITKIIIRQFAPDETFWMTGDQMQYLGDDVSYAVWPGELDDVVVDDDSDSDASSTDEAVDLLTAGDVREVNGLTVTAVYTDKTGKRTEPTEYIPGGMLTISVNSQDLFLSEAFLDVLAVNTQFDMYAPRSGQRLGEFVINHPTPWEMDRAILDPLGWRKPRRPDDMIPGGVAEVDGSQAVVFRNSFETRPREPVEGVELEEGETEDVALHPSKFDIVWFCPAPELGPARVSLNFRFHRSSAWQTVTLTLRESPKRIRTGVDNKAEAVLQYNFDQEARHRDFFRFVAAKNWDAVEPFLDKKCVLFKEKSLKKRRWRCMDALEDIFDHHKGIVVPSPIIFKGGLTKSVVMMEQCPLWTLHAADDDDEDDEDDDEGGEEEDEEDEYGDEEEEGDGGGGGEARGEGGGGDEDAFTDAESLPLSLSRPESSALADADPRPTSLIDRPPASHEDSEHQDSEHEDHHDGHDRESGSRGSDRGSSQSSSPATSPRSSLPGGRTARPRASPRGESGTSLAPSAGGGPGPQQPSPAAAEHLSPRPEGTRVVRFASKVQVEEFVADDGSPTSSSPRAASPSSAQHHQENHHHQQHQHHHHHEQQQQHPATAAAHAHAGPLGPAGTVGPMGIFDADDDDDDGEEHGRSKAGHLGLPEFMFTAPVVGKPFQREVLRLARKEANNVLGMKAANIACVKEMRLYSTDPQRQAALAAIPSAPEWIRSSFLRPQPAAPEVKRPHRGYYDLKTHSFLKTDIFGPDIQKFSFPLPTNYPKRAGAARHAFRLQLGEYEKTRRKMAAEAVVKPSAVDEEDDEDEAQGGGLAGEMRKFRRGMHALEAAIKGQVALHLVAESAYQGTRRNALGVLPGMQPHYPNPFYAEPCVEMGYMVPAPPDVPGRFPAFIRLWGRDVVHAGKVPPVGRRPAPLVAEETLALEEEGGEREEEEKEGEGRGVEMTGAASEGRPPSGASSASHPATPPLHADSKDGKSHHGHGAPGQAGHEMDGPAGTAEGARHRRRSSAALLSAAFGWAAGAGEGEGEEKEKMEEEGQDKEEKEEEEEEEEEEVRAARVAAEAAEAEALRRRRARIPQDVFLGRRGSFPFAPGLEPFDNGVKDKVKTLHTEEEHDSHHHGHGHHRHHHHHHHRKKKSAAFVPNDEIDTVASGGLVRALQQHGREYTHQGAVTDLKFAPSEARLASAGGDGVVKIWDPRDGTLVRVLEGHEGAVTGLAYSADELYLVSVGEDKQVLIWDMTSNAIFKRLRGHKDVVTSVSISPDCTLLLTSSHDMAVKSWYMTPRPPAAPEPPRVIFKTDTTVLISWSAPPAFNLDITAFHLQSRIGLRGDWEPPEHKPHTVMPSLRSASIGALAANTIYQFRVRAENLMGLGLWSQPSRLTHTELGFPGEVEIPKICGCSHTSLTIYWFTPNPKTFAGASRRFEVGHSGEGRGFDESAPHPATLDEGLAGGRRVLAFFRGKLAVKKVKVVQRKEKSSLEPEEDMGFTIANEFMQDILDKAADDELELFVAVEVPGLAPGFQYRVRVRGVNEAGAGPWSPASYSIMTLATPPSTPLRPFIEARGMTSIRFAWHAPDGNGSAVTGYTINVQHTGKEHHVPRSQLHWDLESLLPGKKYFIRVLASNAIGASPYSDWNEDSYQQAQTLTDKPERPRNPLVVLGTWHSMTLDIRLPYDNGDHLTSMIVMSRWVQPFDKGDWTSPRSFLLPDEVKVVEWVDPDGLLKHLLERQRREEDERKAGYNPLKKKKNALDIAAVLSAAKPEGSLVRVVIADLQPDTIYEFRVACRNAAGFSAYSNPSHRAKTNKARLPGPPVEFIITDVSETEVVFMAAWNEHGGAYIDRYSAEMLRKGPSERSFAVVWDRPEPLSAPLGPVTLSIAEHIHRATIYQFRVRAESSLGRGPFSDWTEDILVPGEQEEHDGSTTMGASRADNGGDDDDDDDEGDDGSRDSELDGADDVIKTATGLSAGADMQIRAPPRSGAPVPRV